MQSEETAIVEKKTIKIWVTPRFVVFGDMRNLTRSASVTGSGDALCEGESCGKAGSAGNSG